MVKMKKKIVYHEIHQIKSVNKIHMYNSKNKKINKRGVTRVDMDRGWTGTS